MRPRASTFWKPSSVLQLVWQPPLSWAGPGLAADSWLEEYDIKLFAEAAESMLKLACELEGEACDCGLCVAFYG